MIKTALLPYQQRASDRAVAALKSGGGFLLLPEPRARKTLIALDVMDRVKPTWTIVVAPKNALAEWGSQLKEHFKLDWGMQLTCIHYEALTSNRKWWYKAVAKAAKDGVEILMIADECHYLKSRGATRSRVVRHLSGFCEYRLGLTGTPIAQGLEDTWALCDFADPSVFGKWDDTIEKKTRRVLEEGFDSTYLVWGGYKKHEIVGYKNEEQFREKFHSISYRITLREAKREGKQSSMILRYSKDLIDLSGKSRKVYQDMEEELYAIIDQRKVSARNVLSTLTKLQQIAGGAVLNEDREVLIVGNEKIEALHTFVRSLRARSKFIVICRFLHELDRVERYLRKLGCSVAQVRGGVPYDREFKTDALVMQIQSGVAVDMSKADVIVFYSTDYSQINFEQSRFRVLSYTKSSAHYHFLLAKGTVDELIYSAIQRKVKLSKLVIDEYRTRRRESGRS
jgi:superfamily II DNA or RNA helicase